MDTIFPRSPIAPAKVAPITAQQITTSGDDDGKHLGIHIQKYDRIETQWVLQHKKVIKHRAKSDDHSDDSAGKRTKACRFPGNDSGGNTIPDYPQAKHNADNDIGTTV